MNTGDEKAKRALLICDLGLQIESDYTTLLLTNTGSCGNNNKLAPTSSAKALSG